MNPKRFRIDPAPRLFITATAIEAVEYRTRQAGDVETGGILMGPPSPDRHTVVVTHASDAGPRAVCEPGMFLRDTEHCSRVLCEHYERFGVDYVGEWHSHTTPLRQPSRGDLATIAAIMHDADYAFTSFGLLIAVPRGDHSSSEIELLGYVALPNVLVQVTLEIVPDAPKEQAE